jgi:hypothetical protein
MTYTTDMSLFVNSTSATKPKNKKIYLASLTFAAILILMVVAQLFKFETFPDIILDMGLTDDGGFASVYAALIVSLEVAAIPFLLGMMLSPAMRVLSMVAGWIVVAVWFVSNLRMSISSHEYVSSGLLGDTVTLSAGWGSVLFCFGLMILAAWVAWGMWPLTQTKHR